jgi:hypothetical protein
MQVFRVLSLMCLASACAVLWSEPQAFAQPAAYCDAQARQFANSYSSPAQAVVGSALAGTAGGAVVGGTIGGKRKSVGRGALMGAGAGAAVGLSGAAVRWQQDYDYAYARCMTATNRRNAPPAGTPAWIDYCSAKYRSFDPASGMYLAYSGVQKPCR